MQENVALRELTNVPLKDTSSRKQPSTFTQLDSAKVSKPRPALADLIKVSDLEIDFGSCLPGSIHEKNFTVKILQDFDSPVQLTIYILCEDQTIYDTNSLVFGIKRAGQQDFYDDYRIKVQARRTYDFKIGVKTPMFYEYDVKSVLIISILDYPPMAVVLKQKAQVPQLVCTKQLFMEESRVIKLSTVHNRGKKECRVPFRMNHNMTIAVTAELLGLPNESHLSGLLEVKPKSMTLSGKGQFSLIITMNTNKEMQDKLGKGETQLVRRILVLRVKDTNFMYHYPVEVAYYPDSKKAPISEI